MVTTQYFFKSHLHTKNETYRIYKVEGYYIIIKYHRIIMKFTIGLKWVSDVFRWCPDALTDMLKDMTSHFVRWCSMPIGPEPPPQGDALVCQTMA